MGSRYWTFFTQLWGDRRKPIFRHEVYDYLVFAKCVIDNGWYGVVKCHNILDCPSDVMDEDEVLWRQLPEDNLTTVFTEIASVMLHRGVEEHGTRPTCPDGCPCLIYFDDGELHEYAREGRLHELPRRVLFHHYDHLMEILLAHMPENSQLCDETWDCADIPIWPSCPKLC